MRHVHLQSDKANCNHLNAGSDSIHRAFHQSTQYHMLVRSKACEEGGGVYSSFRHVQILPKLIHIFLYINCGHAKECFSVTPLLLCFYFLLF